MSSSLRNFTRKALLGAATTSPWTTNYRHLLPIPKKWRKRSTIQDPVLKSVRPQDRIKHWNIVPGDQIRIRGDKDTLHEVLSINRISNRVFIKGAVNSSTKDSNKVAQSKNYHYSECRLFVGNYEFPPSDGSSQPETRPVFAERLGTSSPVWNPWISRFEWKRYAVKTDPAIPYQRGERILIEWPKPVSKKYPEPAQHDTPKEEVVKVTYQPPLFPLESSQMTPRAPSEEEYLTSLYNPSLVSVDNSAPAEIYLFRELSNPHSRSKKLKRWKQRQFANKTLYQNILKEELKHLNGRSEREAKAEAAFKWRHQLEEEKEAEIKLRWKHRATEAKTERRQARKERKEVKQRKRLTELMLKDERNQVIPSYV